MDQKHLRYRAEKEEIVQNQNSLIIIVFSICVVFSTCIISSDASAEKRWKVERRDKGIVVSKRSEKGRDLPSFKGVGKVKADMYKILGILRDGSRRKEWMSRSGVTKVLIRKGIFTATSYQQTIAPWPVSDRDVVMHTQIYLRKNPRELIATFDGIKWDKAIKGVDRDDFVSMPYLKGYWRLTPISELETEVTYMVNTDPGGLLPNWLIKRITKDLPYYTILGLRKQVKRSKKRYRDFLHKYDPKYTNGAPKEIPPEPPAHIIEYMN